MERKEGGKKEVLGRWEAETEEPEGPGRNAVSSWAGPALRLQTLWLQTLEA